MVSCSGGFSTKLGNGHDGSSITLFDQNKALQGWRLFYFKWRNLYLENLGSNIYLAVNVSVTKNEAIYFFVTARGFCNLERNISLNIYESTQRFNSVDCSTPK